MPAVFSLRTSLFCLCAALGLLGGASTWADASLGLIAGGAARDVGLPLADKVLVRKSERRLYLLSKGEVLRSYVIRLGLAPQGQKEQEGDFRTPEGRYRLVRRNPNSEFFLSMQVSYPNEQDMARARSLGVRPGGAIMIHGLPNVPKKPLDYYEKVDWTDGCIAVSNSDMVEIWLMTPLDTPIEIQP
jgi:murein L,D-transpeptidase YafK